MHCTSTRLRDETMSGESYHEPIDLIKEETKNLHRGIVTLIEELEAVDWYQQRSDACSNDELRAVIDHNRNEEIEHAMMTLEWLRRHHDVFATHIDTYLNTPTPITEAEQEQKRQRNTGGDGALCGDVASSSSSLGIGSLRGTK
jgi:ferritin-like protein